MITMKPKFNQLFVVGGSVLTGLLLIVLIGFFSQYIMTRVAPGLSFHILGPSTLQIGSKATITWDTSPENRAKYPMEKIEFCSDKSGKDCIVLALSVPNNGKATVAIPKLNVGKGYLKLSARDTSGVLANGLRSLSSVLGIADTTKEVEVHDGTSNTSIVETVSTVISTITPSVPPPSQGQTTVQSCSGMNGVSEPCYWRYEYNANACAGGACSKMVIFFSGGEMNCDDSYGNSNTVYGKILDSYAQDGYVAVCAGTFITNKGGQSTPYSQEATRVDTLVKDIRASADIRNAWNGQQLLFSGVSHGATAPVTTMAQTTLDDQVAWKGTKTTGACFLDGMYDPVAADAFLQAGTPRAQCDALHTATACARYFNTPNFCPAVTRSNSVAAQDTIVNTNPSVFAISNWKLVECGSALSACGVAGNPTAGDALPAGPIQQLCANIQGTPQRSCTFGSLPDQSHQMCAGTPQGINECQGWFDGIAR
ncbi:MAG: hypothetical protein K8Q97_00830 [Candidatus Andersenbacteria bacterium]|nr:hypothetical protein [Candidatus Andersenbacteria bacterium]